MATRAAGSKTPDSFGIGVSSHDCSKEAEAAHHSEAAAARAGRRRLASGARHVRPAAPLRHHRLALRFGTEREGFLTSSSPGSA